METNEFLKELTWIFVDQVLLEQNKKVPEGVSLSKSKHLQKPFLLSSENENVYKESKCNRQKSKPVLEKK